MARNAPFNGMDQPIVPVSTMKLVTQVAAAGSRPMTRPYRKELLTSGTIPSPAPPVVPMMGQPLGKDAGGNNTDVVELNM